METLGFIGAVLGGTILVFILITLFGAIRRMRSEGQRAGKLSPEAAAQFRHWLTEADKAVVKGDERAQRVARAKALSVEASGIPIAVSSNSALPLVCQPGYIDSLGDAELNDLIAGFEVGE